MGTRLLTQRNLIVATALTCVTLVLLRAASELSFHEPLYRPTTGAEEEPLFTIWKVTQGQPVFSNSLQIPYSGVVFNWLFFFSYGAVASLFTNILHIDCGWIPTVARLLTLLATLAAGVAFLWIGNEQQLWPEPWSSWEKISLAAIAVCNPVAGFFVFSARPDMPALFCEFVGLALLFRYIRKGSIELLIYATIALFFAWSFKQTSVFVVGGICLWLGIAKRFSDLLVVCLITGTLYLGAFLIGGSDYSYAILKSQSSCEFHFSYALGNLITALERAPLLFLALVVWIAALFSPTRRRAQIHSPIAVVFVFSFFCSALIASKEGAGSNYFISPSALGALWLIQVWTSESDLRRYLMLRRVVTVALCLQLADAAITLFARTHVNRANAEHQRHRNLARQLARLEPPILVGDRFDNLPWIQRKPPYFVYSYVYWFDRRAGRRFALGGLGGLIHDRYFRSIVLRHEPSLGSFDGANLDDYVRTESSDGYDFYIRREDDGRGKQP